MRKFMIFVFIVAATGIGGLGPAWCKHKKPHPKPSPPRHLNLAPINGESLDNKHKGEIEVLRKMPTSNGHRAGGPADRVGSHNSTVKR